MLYNLNPYKIFEQLPDFVVTSSIFNDDLILGSHFYTYPSDLDKKLDGTHHQLVRTRTYNRYDFYRSPRRVLQYPADRESGRYVTPEAGYYRATSLGLAPDGYLGNSYTLRRYNFFFSELSGFECKARALSGVGTWSFTFIPNDYFFKWFYYKY
jgi:hypothetical protein